MSQINIGVSGATLKGLPRAVLRPGRVVNAHRCLQPMEVTADVAPLIVRRTKADTQPDTHPRCLCMMALYGTKAQPN